MLKRREMLVGAVALSVAAKATAAQPSKPHERSLEGTWSMIGAMTVQEDGQTGPWNGIPGPYSGLIVYQPNGMMSVQISGARLALPADSDFTKLPAEQQLTYLRSYYAYYGRYSFDETQSVVTHFVSSSLDPTAIGIVYRRKVNLVGDVLTLTTIPAATSSSARYNVLSWRRV